MSEAVVGMYVAPVRDDTALYAELKRKITEAGLFKPAWFFYAKTLVYLGVPILACLYILYASDSWLRILLAPVMSYLLTQTSYIAHDAGHRQLSKSTLVNDIVLLIVDPIVGLSPSWWMSAHNAHHSFPNDVQRDPNYRVGILAFSNSQLLEKSAFMKKVCRWQGWYYVPAIMTETLAMRFESFRFLRKGGRYQRLESLGLLVYFVSHFGFLYLTLGLWGAVGFSIIHQLLLGLYLGAVFAPNHKGMHVVLPGEELSFLERQTITARNVRPGFFTDRFMGGLNYQLEHHLFPTVGRNEMKAVRSIVKPFCEQNNISYYETGIWKSYKEIAGFLDSTGRGEEPKVVEPHMVVA